MDDTNPISPLQSGTIRAALKAIAVNVAALVAIATGKAFDLDAVNAAIDAGVPLLVNGISIYYGLRAIRGRIHATQTIKQKEN